MFPYTLLLWLNLYLYYTYSSLNFKIYKTRCDAADIEIKLHAILKDVADSTNDATQPKITGFTQPMKWMSEGLLEHIIQLIAEDDHVSIS